MKKRRRLKILANAARLVFEDFDKHVEPILEREEPTCTRGCMACCKQLVTVTVAEAAQILDTHRAEVSSRLATLLDQAKTIAELSKELPQGDDRLSLPEEVRVAAGLYWRLQRSCAFLTEEGDCSIYAVRPLACRGYFVVSDPELCAQREPVDVQIMEIHRQSVLINNLIQFEKRVFQSSGSVGPLQIMVLALWGKM